MYQSWCISLMLTAVVSEQTGLRVSTSDGEIYGLQDDFIKFLGIPYAIVDEKDPFGPAYPAPRHDVPYSAVKDPVICPQIVEGMPQGSIHCLNLNIYKAINEKQTNPLPVMVFIHGGAFREGDGNIGTYSPIFLVKHDVIMVTVNYRLGPYGFLCLEEDKYTNQGLKDQVLALKWIKSNIKYFGGDENNILLFGHSAGSFCVDFHLLLNEEKVFNKVILQSGVMASPLLHKTPNSNDYIAGVAARLKLQTEDVNTIDLLTKLANTDTGVLINITRDDVFRPCVNHATIKDANDLKSIKIMIGNAEKEMIFVYKDVLDYKNKIRNEMKTCTDNIPESYIDKVEDLYLKNNLKDDTIEFSTDFYFIYPIERSLKHYMKHNATVYRYVFSYDGGRNFIKTRDNITAKGATHGDELGYVFDSDLFKKEITIEDQLVIKSITTFWTNFAKYGNPTGLSTRWPPIMGDVEYYMDIGRLSSVHKNYRLYEMRSWDDFYEEFGVHFKGIRYEEETINWNAVTQLYTPVSLVVAMIVVALVM